MPAATVPAATAPDSTSPRAQRHVRPARRTRRAGRAWWAAATLGALMACGPAPSDDAAREDATREDATPAPAPASPLHAPRESATDGAHDTDPALGTDGAPRTHAGDGFPALTFTEITHAAGIAFVHENGARGKKLLPETMGGGCAFLDHDGDGDADIFLVNGRPWDGDPVAPGANATSVLYRNDGTGRFEDVSAAAGLDLRVYGMGVACGDSDGDGDEDLFVTALGPDVLLANDAGRFTDVTARANVAGAPDGWSTAAAHLDADNDGDLDLFVGRYVQWTAELDLAVERRIDGLPGRAYLPPMSFAGTQPVLFRNEGDGTFRDVSAASGVHVVDASTGAPVAKMLAVLPVDFDLDGDVDLFAANDTVRNFLYRNDRGTFTEIGVDAGLAYDRVGLNTGAMGVDAGDLLGDGGLALVVGNFADEMTSAYVAAPDRSFFTDETVALGLGAPTRAALTFGLLLLDVDLDGRLDILAANGHLEEDIAEAQPGQSYAQPAQLFWNTGARDHTALRRIPSPGDLARPAVGRGLTAADIDGDGDLDVLLTQPGAEARLLRSDQSTGHGWLAVDVHGSTELPNVLGARVSVTAGGRTATRDVRTARSYLSAAPRTLTFGLGTADVVEALTVQWPDGTLQDVPPPAPGERVRVTRTTPRPDPAAALNAAKAQLENGDARAALQSLADAARFGVDDPSLLRNIARAHLLAGAPATALDVLVRARAAAPHDAAAQYLSGIAWLRVGNHHEALPFLEEAARLDPLTAAVRFQLATAYELHGREGDARVQFAEAARLDPSHSAAHFQLALAARKDGDTDGYRAHNREFLRLRALYGDAYKSPISLERCVHTAAEAWDGARAPTSPPAGIDVRFTDVSAEWIPGARATSLAAFSVDDTGRLAFVASDAEGRLLRMTFGAEGRLVVTPLDASLSAAPHDLVVGNVYDPPAPSSRDALPVRRADLVLATSAGLTLFEQGVDGGFADTTERAGLADLGARRLLLTDADHDGDLDLVLAGDDGLRLFLAAGDGTLRDGSEESGIPATGPCVDVAAADLSGNGAVDLVVARGDGHPTRVIENRRGGRFAAQPEPPGPLPPARRVLIEHLDDDDDADVILVGARDVTVLRARGTRRQVVPLDGLDPAAACVLDHDADGRVDLVLAGARDARGALLLLRNTGDGTFVDATASAALDAPTWPPLADVLAADVDGDRDDDLLLRAGDGQILALRNDGGHVHGLLPLRLLSLVNTSGGIGTRVQVRAGDFVATRLAARELPVSIGLGGRTSLDSVQTLWPNGIVDNRLDVEVGDEPLTIAVLEQVDTGSCPFLFVWDGTRFRFVNDMLGSAAVGLPFARGVSAPVNPSEMVEIGPSSTLAAVDGAFLVRVTSELREAAYYDAAALVAVDHAPGLAVHSTDRLRGPPFPPSEPWLLDDLRAPRAARGDDGIDRTAAVAALDGVFAPPGTVRPAPLRGVCEPLAIELDFGALPDHDDLVLLLTGWIEYGTASTNIALSQDASIPVLFPVLEAADAAGVWTELDVVVGLPAGKVKTLLVPLGGRLPPGAVRLRLRTTFQLAWDRIALGRRVPLDAGDVHVVRPDGAELRWRGYSDLRARAPGHPRTPDYERVHATPPWTTSLSGWATRYGDVLPLVDAVDGKLCVLNGGDELVLRFAADALPPVPAGLVRTYLFHSHGYNKENDPNTHLGDVLWPLGVEHDFGRTPDEDDAWRIEYNTRWVPREW